MSTKITSMKRILIFQIVIILSLGFYGCKSPPAEKNVVIPPEYAKLMKDMEKQGFQKAWGKPKIIKQYDKIEIAVEISPVQLHESWWAEQNIRNLVSTKKDDMKYVATYVKDSFIKAFSKSKELKLVKKPGPKTLALEFSIVQLVPNKPVLGAISNLTNLTPIGLLLSPVKMGIKSSSPDSGGAIAMETIIRDSEDGKILAVVAERAKGKVAYFNAKDFTAYGSVRAIIDCWTARIVKALDQIRQGKKVNVESGSAWKVIDY